MGLRIEIDGRIYDLVPALSRDAIAIYLDIHIQENGRRVALVRLRCAASEPQYEMIERMAIEELLERVIQRGGLEGHVRVALQWQSDLHKINSEWGISPLYQAWFPENFSADQ